MADENNIMEQIDYLKNLIENIDKRLNLLLKTVEESNETLSFLKNEEYIKSEDVKISIGSGMFARASISSDKVLTPIGSNIYIEKKKEEIINDLNNNIKDFNVTYNNLISQKEKAKNNYDALVYAIQNSRQRGN